MTKNNNKILKIIIYSLLILVAVGGLATAFLINYNPYIPDVVQVVSNQDQTLLFVQPNDSYVGYRFVFKDVAGGDEIVLESKSNSVTLDECTREGITLGRTYKVKFCYLSNMEANCSRYSDEIEFRAEITLEAPSLSLEGENLVWDRIERADYYIVQYNNNGGLLSKRVAQTQNQKIKFPISEVEVGDRGFYVIACSELDYIKTSQSSNIVETRVVRKMEGFSSISFDGDKTLTLLTKESLNEIIIYVGEDGFRCYEFTKTLNGDIYTYKVDVSSIYVKDKKLGAKPVDIDEYNIYEGEIIYAQ